MTAMAAQMRRVRPGLRRVALLAAAVLGPIAAFQVWDYVELRALVREVERVRAAGETLDERAAPGAFGFIQPGPHTAGPHYLAAGLLALGSGAGQALGPVRAWAADPSGPRADLDALVAPVHAVVARSGAALGLVEVAGALPYAGLPAGTEFSYRVASLHALAGVVAAEVVAESAAGRGDAAVASALALLKLRVPLRDVRWSRGSELPIGVLLSLSTPSEEALVRLQQAIEGADRAARGREDFVRERARVFERWRPQHGVDPRRAGQLEPSRSPSAVLRPVAARRTTRVLRRWAALVPALDRPWAEIAPLLSPAAAAEATSPAWADDAFRAIVLDPTLALDRAARAAIAVTRYARDHGGRPPAVLGDLVPRYLTAVPADPFGTGPLAYRPEAGRFTVYSFGPDARDDGGDLTSRPPAGALRGPSERGLDVGVRVARGLAAP